MARVLTDRSIITGSGAQRHDTWLELFFDLVVVAAVATLGEQLHDDHIIVLVEVRISSATANPPGPIDERSTPKVSWDVTARL